ncbi:MAG: transcriptional regulator with XRE-family HTH domain [Myxococcota bacterium]|jgi:transcriptional regulator with XRE-family HTH domain
MPRTVTPASAVVELSLVRDALAAHDCSHDSLACRMGVCKASVGHWMSGARRPSAGMIAAAVQHDPGVALDIIVSLCQLAGIDPGDVLREQARREVAREALLDVAARLVDQAEQLPTLRRVA